MNVARGRDFNDDMAEFGPEAVRAALDAAQYPWPDAPPFEGDETAPPAVIRATPFVWRDACSGAGSPVPVSPATVRPGDSAVPGPRSCARRAAFSMEAASPPPSP